MKKAFLQDVVIIRLVLILLLVLYHAFAVYCGAWDMPEGVTSVKAYWWIASLAYSFMLETFVFLSGYVYGFQVRTKYNGAIDFRSTVVNKSKRLLIPSVFFSILYILCFNLRKDVGITQYVYDVLNGAGHMWFLPMLFWCFVALFIVEKLHLSAKTVLILALAASMLSLFTLPFRISSAAYYFLFFYIGYVLQRFDVQVVLKIKPKTVLLFAVSYLGVFLLSKISLNEKAVLDIAQESLINKVISSLLNRVSTLAYSILGVGFIYSLVNCILRNNNISLNTRILKLSGYCFGVYIFQQFILKIIMYNDRMIALFGSYWLPWVAFIIALVVSILISSALLKTKVGRFLIG